MAVAGLLPDSTVDSVKSAVRSSTTCSTSTVSSLQTLLRGTTKATLAIEAKAIKKDTKTRTRETTSRPVSRTARAKSIGNDVASQGGRLSTQERLVLATEVFNSTLKTLSDSLKTPLRSTSPNRAQAPPRKKQDSNSKQTVKEPRGENGVSAVAECARLALSCLRALKTEQSSQGDLFPNIQLEQGACVLAGKLISLGLNELAFKELCSLKKRIQRYLEDSNHDQKPNEERSKSRGAPEDESTRESLISMLSFSSIGKEKGLHALLVSFQANALRLAAAEKKASVVQRLYPAIQTLNPSSPTKVILAVVESGGLTKDKAALQLQILSSTILSMTQRSSENGTSAGDLKPITSLCMQILALETRCLGWKLSGHVCDEGKEMWDPLARYLASFVHQDSGIQKSEFAMLYKNILRVQSIVSSVKKTSTRDTISVAKIATLLGQLAQEAGCFEEALKLFNESTDPLSAAQSITLGTVYCKIALIHFQVSRSTGQSTPNAASDSLKNATAALGLHLKGSASDLDELLVEAAKLKKLAISYLGDTVLKEREKRSEGVDLPGQVREYLQGFVRFIRRYIGSRPQDDAQPKEHELFQARVQSSWNIALAAVDSAVAVGKLSVVSSRPPWNDMLAILSDCQRLLVTLLEAKPDCQETDNVGMGLVKLSNLFWSRYLKEREAGKDHRDLLPLLKHSTGLLSPCLTSHRETGFAALKFERLAHLCLDANMIKESEKAFRHSIQEHISAGAIQPASQNPSQSHPHSFCRDSGNAGLSLIRVLTSYIKMKIRRKELKTPELFDDDSLEISERGFLLELQMNLLADLYQHAHSQEAFRCMFTAVVTRLLDFYQPDVYPIRRTRVILHALRLGLNQQNCVELSLLSSLEEQGAAVIEIGTQIYDDVDLADFATHLENSLRLTLGLHHGRLSSDELSNIVSSWASMTQSCGDWQSIESCVHDTDYWIIQLKSLVDYTEIFGLWKTQLAALELVLRVMELQENTDYSEITILLSRLALHYCRLGYCKKAAVMLSRAEMYMEKRSVSCLATLSCKLARVDYLLETGKVDTAAQVLSSAKGLYDSHHTAEDPTSLSFQAKIAWERLVADAVFMQSRLSFAQGSAERALFFSKLSVKLNCRIWAKIERLSQRQLEKSTKIESDSSVNTVAEGIANLNLSQSSSPSDGSITYTQGAPFWPHIGSHHTSLLNLATLSAHYGLFQDAVYYGEQALKISKTLNANVRLIGCQAQLGYYWICGGHLSKGQELLEMAQGMSQQLEGCMELVSLQMSLAALYKAQGHHEEELLALTEANTLLSNIIQTDHPDASPASSAVSGLEEKMGKLRVREPSRKTRQQTTAVTTTTRRTRTTTTKTATNKGQQNAEATTSLATESNSLLRLKGDILRYQAACARELSNFDKAEALLSDSRQFATSTGSRISHQIGMSEHLLADAIRHLAMHAVYCVLPESTISLPSLQPVDAVAQKEPVTTAKSSATSTRRAKAAPARGTRSRAQKATEDFSLMLSKAGECLNEILPQATTLGSTLDSHAASCLLSRISMLSHATVPGCSTTWAQAPATVNEYGRIGAFARERMAIEIDKQLADFSDPLLWVNSQATGTQADTNISADFNQKYIEILPENWNVLSLSLSADRSEFVVSKLCKGRSPFLLRLPLKRGNSEDGDEEEEEQFLFSDGREEMQEIIKLANKSAHDAKAQTDKQSKKEWWKIRESVDRRLENLLENIENVWFGGFRGVFSPAPLQTVHLSRFAASFHNILDKHLPSRRKGGRNVNAKLTLHQNVLELFTGLKDLVEHKDPEECLMDLLYFVVDILQFQGERNAYDEIDFDMMVVETLDALRSYHENIQHEPVRQPQHTVLVLDKALHLFPWESLPCLQGLPVTRVPSLESLRDRVLQLRHDFGDAARQRASIDRNNGTYILNPSGDLKSTQETFEKDLSGLEQWTGIAKREPSEEEFKEALETKSIFLYFGHGSGAQYIRGRTIKRLDQCAVTFLMGCSSGALTESGDYEPYGTPMNYLHAGSPALVATLWDVTDKDIDRFSASTLEKWGLLGTDSTKKGKSKATGKAHDDFPEDTRVGLDEAVAQSRSSCVLKYLNGAAPVIYGIPVFLD
ncbi:hypothetical protein ASPZODRAFT_160438 [Penicilliopsis zonata CBS 506.65]|uniref:separase n=1 Tax=Penicilliopsis zonata CBS 506.65 TaxID=1073090 RepID=A0A1L9SCJ6_9EURO|nr:hypothetical protein ASPZODRAFT_160438 [Penicilliopsis zonata CBS 506.65]OJJ44901.1 hypothetical protein ASPZODRAFT_160438 [Penicilliopsis zonata CBS 506.65]